MHSLLAQCWQQCLWKTLSGMSEVSAYSVFCAFFTYKQPLVASSSLKGKGTKLPLLLFGQKCVLLQVYDF